MRHISGSERSQRLHLLQVFNRVKPFMALALLGFWRKWLACDVVSRATSSALRLGGYGNFDAVRKLHQAG